MEPSRPFITANQIYHAKGSNVIFIFKIQQRGRLAGHLPLENVPGAQAMQLETSKPPALYVPVAQGTQAMPP